MYLRLHRGGIFDYIMMYDNRKLASFGTDSENSQGKKSRNGDKRRCATDGEMARLALQTMTFAL